MIITELIGGLGNQMFQYAFGLSLSEQYQVPLKVDISGFDQYETHAFALDKLSCRLEQATDKEITYYKKYNSKKDSFIHRLKKKPVYYVESQFTHIKNLPFLKRAYVSGYWQSEKYFNHYRDRLLNEFKLKQDLSVFTNDIIQDTLKQTSVSLHVRRGDYITNPDANRVHGSCSLDYYKNAIEYIKKQNSLFKTYVFSDDIEWAKKNLNFIEDIFFIEKPNSIDDCEEMILMSKCQHNIIANSTFSWWGAWLNQNPNKLVITPKKWFNDTTKNCSDLIPVNWVRL